MESKEQYTRREFLRKRFGGWREALNALGEAQTVGREPSPAVEAPGHTVPPAKVLRPPGAIEEGAFLEGCTRCGDCITACPYHVIRRASSGMGALEGTPVLDYTVEACMMCSDYPCIRSCEPRVLRHDAGVKMGTARILAEHCLAYQGTVCTVCSDRCPVPNAIERPGGKPNVASSVCTGCGVCQIVCIAPENAVMIVPERKRPLPA